MSQAASASLLFTPLQHRDSTLFCSLYSDAERMRHIGAAMAERDAQRAFQATLKAQQRAPRPRWDWVGRLPGGDAAGLFGLIAETADGDTGVSLQAGIVLLAQHQGLGLALRGLGTLTDHGFRYCGAQRIRVHHAAGNHSARRVMQRSGFACLSGGGDHWTWQLERCAWTPSP